MRSSVEEMKRLSERISSLNRQLAVLSRQLNELAKPILTDYGLLPYIWVEFVAFSKKRGRSVNNAYERRKFLFVVLFLYDPLVLFKKKMSNGLRSAIINAIGADFAGSSISHNIENVIFFYQTYDGFSRDIDQFCAEICEKLGKKLPRRS